MAKLKIKKGDLVQVLSGKDKGLQGKVISVDTETQRVVVEGVQRVTRHTKAGFGGQAGGLVVSEASIHVTRQSTASGDPMASSRGNRAS